MSGDITNRLIVALLTAGEQATLDMPHVVVTIDPAVPDNPIIFGPFPNPVAAAEFAEAHSRAYLSAEYPEPIACAIVPMHPA